MDRASEKSILKNSFGQSHEIMTKTVKEGDTVVDATAGNGGDTLFLAQLAGSAGKVYSFDIQQAALDRTLEKFKATGVEDRVSPVCDGHQNMTRHITENCPPILICIEKLY